MSSDVIRRLLTPCMACNREAGQPMCPLCSNLEDAEDRADHDEPRGRDDDHDRD